MRKLVTLGLLALFASVLSGSVLAGAVDECNYLRDSSHPDYDPEFHPSLFGLCVAWHNADEAAKQNLWDKFFDRASFPVTGPVKEEPQPLPEPDFLCPCWNELSYQDVCDLGTPKGVTLPAGSLYGVVTFIDFLTFTAEGFGSEGQGGSCGHFLQDLKSNETIPLDNNGGSPLSLDEATACRAELETIATLHVDPVCAEE